MNDYATIKGGVNKFDSESTKCLEDNLLWGIFHLSENY